jgi:hypothetical protein
MSRASDLCDYLDVHPDRCKLGTFVNEGGHEQSLVRALTDIVRKAEVLEASCGPAISDGMCQADPDAADELGRALRALPVLRFERRA